MTLRPGQTLSHYRIEEKIGSGGMGEVWAAEDTRLKRRVALKVLPPGTSEDPHLRARFEREARAVAALNHPGIVTIHSVEEADGLLFLTMELVQGEPLSRRTGSPLPLDELFRIGIPLADAVGAAHHAGILHRDLKPDNIMLTSGGAVKVLDFGLAKLRDQVGELAAGSGDDLTREDRIVGTAAYMSPEQAEGKAVGPESDVFALGVILYQLATGKRPFTGGTTISMISAILKEDPAPVTQVNRSLPRHLGRIVRRALAKDPTRRYATAWELRNELELLQQEIAGPTADAEGAVERPARRGTLLVTGAGLAAMTVVAVIGWLPRSTDDVLRTPGARVSQQTFLGGMETHPSLSPDGQFLVYTAGTVVEGADIFLQRVDGQKPINLTPDSPAFDGQPAFSPSGKQIAFRSDRDGGGIFVMGATGESVRRLTDEGFDPAWSPDGAKVVFARERFDTPLERYDLSPLTLVDVETGESRQIYGRDAMEPAWSPGGHRIAFWTARIDEPDVGRRDIATILPDGSGMELVTDDDAVDWRPAWAPDGRHLYFSSDRGGSMNLWRVPIDEESGRPLGGPEPVTMPSLWSGPFAISGDGSQLAYVARDERSRLVSVPFDPARGAIDGEPVTVTQGALIIGTWAVSPDGEWIALANTGRQEDLYLVRPDGEGMRKLTDDLEKDRGVSWLDDDRLLFYSARGATYEIWTVRKDGSDLRPVTAETSGYSLMEPAVSPDGKRLLAHTYDATYVFDLEKPRPLHKDEAEEIVIGAETGGTFRGMHWSPDGVRLLGEVGPPLSPTVALYDPGDGSLRLLEPPVEGKSTAGGWLPDGRRALATAGGAAWIVDTGTGEWRQLPLHIGYGDARFSADGRQILFVERTTQADIWIARLD